MEITDLTQALENYNNYGGNMMSDKEWNFRRELASLINKYSKENESNTPDYILADYLANCLTAFATCSRHREAWFGKELTI